MKNWRLLFAIRKGYAKDGASTDLKITDNCIIRLREVASAGEHLRIMVDGGGCSGFEYKMSLDSKINDNDLVFCKDHIKIVVDEVHFCILLERFVLKTSEEVVERKLGLTSCLIGKRIKLLHHRLCRSPINSSWYYRWLLQSCHVKSKTVSIKSRRSGI